ncbi:unnamed protein product [Vicia faba]|uniref:Uncharacterized protein n=1 Tax=Vicia faba TaxID=3906 RepID=A0AAV1ALX7_VICFA|nr:unnamed protein product [Vicia faba]
MMRLLKAKNEVVLSGWMSFIFNQKLEFLKKDLKRWNNEVSNDLDAKICVISEDIKRLDLKGETSVLSLDKIYDRSKVFMDTWGFLKCKESMAIRRSGFRKV